MRAHWLRARLDAAVGLIGNGPGSLLEVGTGTGRLLAAVARQNWTATGIDAAPRMIELARARVSSSRARLILARAEALPFGDAAFDVVVAIGVLDFTDPHVSFGEIARVLRSGGRAVVAFRRKKAPAIFCHDVVMLPLMRGLKSIVAFGGPVPRPLPKIGLDYAYKVFRSVGLSVERREHRACVLLPDPLDRLAPRLAYRMSRVAERSPGLRRLFGCEAIVVCRKP